MQSYYFTFGSDHILKNKYIRIVAKSYWEAREEMMASFGNKWSMQYTEEDFKGQPEKYGIVEIK